ncbi:MAG: clostripain-related cysteine peptidase [Methanocorpusculum sp.]|nr:clostripain-related cysteine peptidase [Methanocorpusculum sp.]MDE2521652.1 clostripain-related cysteine peptidase [Methanocorpusculum sp.]MDE2525247.1 clostripain-related cysteine peptidase [Methanocorpusculum sp.]
MIPENQQRIRTASAVLVLLLVAACIFPAAAAGTDSGTAKNYLIIYIVGADLESEHGEMSVLMQNMTSSWNPDAGEMLIIYGGSQKPGWDTGITITNASLLARDLSAHNGNVSEDAAVLERISADISTPDGLRESLTFAETYQHRMNLADANTYLIFLDHGGGASGYGMNTVTGTMLSLPDMADGLSGRTYDMIVMHACLMGTVETLNTLDDHADYLIAAEQIVDCGAVNYTKLGRTLSENPAISPRELGVEIIETARENHVSTYALIESAKVPGVVDALNTFGAALEDALSSANSIPAVTDAYHETQLFGVSSGADTPVSIDLWQFADIISANTWEGDLHTAAGEMMAAVDAAVIAATDDGQYSSAKGISVTSFPLLYLSTLPGKEVLHESVSLGNDGWYRFYTAYVSTAPKTNVTPASDAEEDTSGITETTAGYLYTVNGSDIVIGERPLEKIYNESDDGIWKMVPTGKYYPCDWDGKWFVLNNGGEDVLISMKYASTMYENGKLREIYSIEGNLTRVVNGVEDTHPSMITVLLDPAAGDVLRMQVFSVLRDEKTGLMSLQLWDTTDLLPGDVFVPDLLVYNESEDTITTVAGTPFTFGANPLENLWYEEFPEDQLSWLVVESNLIDEEVTASIGGDISSSGDVVPSPTASPVPLAGIFAGLAAAGVFLLRRA